MASSRDVVPQSVPVLAETGSQWPDTSGVMVLLATFDQDEGVNWIEN
jgi:hypothetical protein